jgi:hypothetical protein
LYALDTSGQPKASDDIAGEPEASTRIREQRERVAAFGHRAHEESPGDEPGRKLDGRVGPLGGQRQRGDSRDDDRGAGEQLGKAHRNSVVWRR